MVNIVLNGKFYEMCKEVYKEQRINDNKFKNIFVDNNFKIFALINGMADLSYELGKYADSLIGNTNVPYLEFILIKIHEKSFKIYNEMRILLENGSASGALSRWRTLQEFLVVALVLLKTPSCAEYYLDYLSIADYKVNKKREKYQRELDLVFSEQDKMVFKNLYEKFLKTKLKLENKGINCDHPYGWAIDTGLKGINMYKLYEYVGEEKNYAFTDEANIYNHSSPRYLVGERGHETTLFSPFEVELPIDLMLTTFDKINKILIDVCIKSEKNEKEKTDFYLETSSSFVLEGQKVLKKTGIVI